MTRRDLLVSAAALAVAPLAAAEDAMLPVIDTHQHLWDLTKFKLAWLKPGSGPPYEASFTPKEYAEATAGLNVVKAVYMEVDVVPEQQQAEADYLIELCSSGKTPTCAAVISGRRATPSRSTPASSRGASSSKASGRCCTSKARRRGTASSRRS